MVHLLLIIIYFAFIGLGLPDSLFGTSWPSMYPQFDVPVSYAGIVSMIIAIGTVISSLNGDKLTRRFGAGKVTAFSVSLTAFAIWGFSFSRSFPMIILFAIPYGLGAGSVDAALNNYVALHYESKHMSWLHCFWGIGTIIGPYVIGYGLTSSGTWVTGYRFVGILLVVMATVLFISQPLWHKRNNPSNSAETPNTKSLSLKEIVNIRGAKEVMLTFFCYCTLEGTTMLWASSYMVLKCNIPEANAAKLASLFYIGLTAGRALSGFLTMKFTDRQMIRAGQAFILVGLIVMLLPFGITTTIIGLILTGLGCAPIYPCIIHSTPSHFGADKSQAVIGVQMASAYTANCIMPALFGVIARNISVSLLPVYLLVSLMVMFLANEALAKKTA
ncbi:MAG: MFS transporter [Clostridia bacterium]|nr:MFS transporter [Clostridia bacterium]